MHLLALLVAAVFSSQFVTPNVDVSAIGLSVNAITAAELWATLPAITITLTGTAAGTIKWELGTKADGTGVNVDVTLQVDDSDGYVFTHNPTNIPLAPITSLGTPTKIYLLYSDTNVQFISAPITITPAFEADPTEIAEYETLADVGLTITNSAWASTEIHYAICSKAPQKVTDFSSAFVSKGTGEAGTGAVSITIPAAKAAELVKSAVDGNIYIYAGITSTTVAAKNAPVPVAVKIPAFTTDKKTLPCSLVKTAADVTLVLTETASTTTWLALGTLKVVVSKNADGANPQTVDVTLGSTAGVATLLIPSEKWELLGFATQPERLYIWAKITDSPTPATDTPAVVTFEPFEIDVETVNEVAIALPQLKITAGVGAWTTTNKAKLKFSLAPLAQKTADGFFESPAIDPGTLTAAGTYTLDTVDLRGQAIAAEGKIYVYVGISADNTTFTYTFEPKTIAVTAATFTVTSDPASVKDSATTLTGAIVLTPAITASLHDATTDEISVYISLDPDAIPSARKLLGKAALDDTDDTYKFEDLDIPDGIKLQEDKPIQVWVSFLKKDKADGTEFILSDKKTITVVEDATALRFEVAPKTMAVSDLATLSGVTVTQTIGKAWTGPIKVQMTYEGAAAHTASGELTANAQGVYTYAWAEPEKTYLAAAVAGKKLTFKVDSKNNGSYLTAGFEITLAAAEVESTFDLLTKQLPWAADLKTTKIEITPLPKASHKWPVGEDEVMVKFAVPAASESNTDPDPKEITVVVEGEEGAEKWYIPANEDLSAFVPEEAPEADILLEVTASINGGDSYLKHKVTFTIKKPEPEKPEAAMGVSPLLSLLAALVFLFVKLF